MLTLTETVFDQICDRAFREYPLEMCGLIAGPAPVDVDGGHRVQTATVFYPCTNVAASSKLYTIDPQQHLRAELDAERQGLEIVGVVHSHTHTEPFPSPTDIAQAPDPAWNYVIVSLKRESPEVRSFHIRQGSVAEEPVTVLPANVGAVNV